ncbi:MAG TPA: NTP transferase domain-containing protein [Longimicrobium sp.]|nr:NTP transferase domain-containing protein [Longimicrobium sp.]
MEGWTGVAFALAPPGAGGLGSRLSKYLHPVAGRPLVWHALHALASVRPPPRALVIVGGADLDPDAFPDLGIPVAVVDSEGGDAAGALRERAGGGPVLAVDGAALVPAAALQRLVDGDRGTMIDDPAGRPLAAFLPALPSGAENGLDSFRSAVPSESRSTDPDGFVVESRAELARATARVRDRLVRALMDAGATFLLPETVLVDVDVRVGRDTVVYPNVVLEGGTTVGDETVIGPGCRIIDSWIGSGVELKGFNYLSHTSVRNRAILEPHVRRGFD